MGKWKAYYHTVDRNNTPFVYVQHSTDMPVHPVGRVCLSRATFENGLGDTLSSGIEANGTVYVRVQ